ncbi:biotin synthase [Ceraceosorus bombacis]|uniref:biotin synthase n=1 Tax=Ceraceosorus bombacis TaxID=401625 RepID=A0A0P1BEU9_9BASI|nr:biotin synthase [Ceraceosorus bombacis]
MSARSISKAASQLLKTQGATLGRVRAAGAANAAHKLDVPSLARGQASAADASQRLTPEPLPTLDTTPSVSSIPRGPAPPDGTTRHDWRRAEVAEIYNSPLLDLIFRSGAVHRVHHPPGSVQLCTLMNIKEGGCSEDCGYCSQSSKYTTPSTPSKLSEVDEVLVEARKARDNGSTRFCMGAAWREVGGRKRGFNRILEMVSEIRGMGMEVCTTLGMLTPEQAVQLKNAGLTAYNHNLDTSREYYGKVVTSRTYDDRISTLEAVRNAGISVCSGGILGLGEEAADRVGLIWEMSRLPEHPESFPVNALVAIPGTPMHGNEPVDIRTMLRTIATARLVLPTSIIRLAAGRHLFTESEQAMCFLAGANAIFTGHKMLTTPTSGWDDDKAMLERWGLRGMRSFEEKRMSSHAPEQHPVEGASPALRAEQEGMGLQRNVAAL